MAEDDGFKDYVRVQDMGEVIKKIRNTDDLFLIAKACILRMEELKSPWSVGETVKEGAGILARMVVNLQNKVGK